MRILLAADCNSPHTHKWLAAMLKDASIEVALCSLSSPVQFPFDNIPVYHANIPQSKLRQLNTAVKLFYYKKYIPTLKKAINDFKPNRVHALYASSYGGMVWYSGIRPYDISVWGTDIYHFPHKNLLTRWLTKSVLEQAERITSSSHIMAIETNKFTDKQILVIPYGVNTDEFIPAKESIDGLNPDDFVIGTVKSFEPTYGIDLLIDAFIRLKSNNPNINFKLLLVGDGSLRQRFENKVLQSRCNNSVIFTGFVPNNKVARYHQCMDVFVAPTVHESFGVSMLEAMSCGKTIVATDIPSYREIDHQSDTIQFIAQRDDKLLADKLMSLYLNKELRNQLGQKSRELVLRYYDQRIIDKTIVDFYRNV